MTITARGDAAQAKTGTKTAYLLPAESASFAATHRVRLGGSLVLQRRAGGRTRSVRLGAFQLRLGKTRVVTAKIGARRIEVFTLDLRKGEYTADAATTVVRIDGTRARLTSTAARRIGRAASVQPITLTCCS